MKKPLERCTPESVGLRSKDITWFINELEHSQTEMHGLMIMRHSKVAAEGWWSPFAPHLRHGLQSHTKTYAATGVGIAYTEGYLKLDERIIDIFPEAAPENPSENLQLLTVRDVLCMGCGMEEMPRNTEHWIKDFLAIPVVHKPGTAYMYNSTGSTLLCAIVERKTGRKFTDYIEEKLFDKIGIDKRNIRWYCMADGTPMGGGGMFASTEDNLRMMMVYANGGVFNGERILAEDYVKLATSNQNDSASEAKNNPLAYDNHLGYGFQIWMCKPEGVYRADGAMGQFTIVCPKQDMIIAINETAVGAHWAQTTLEICWKYLALIDQNPVEENETDTDILTRKLKALHLNAPVYQPESSWIEKVCGKTYEVLPPEEKEEEAPKGPFPAPKPSLDIRQVSFMDPKKAPGAKSFRMDFNEYGCDLTLTFEDHEDVVPIATYGDRMTALLNAPDAQTRLIATDGAWTVENEFTVNIRWTETCFVKQLKFQFDEAGCTIVDGLAKSFPFPMEIPPVKAVLKA